jgi:hypothetical protein
MDPDQPAHSRSLIRIHAVCLQTLLQVDKLIANSMDPDQTVRMRRLVWIHAGRKPIMLVLMWRGSIMYLVISGSTQLFCALFYVDRSMFYIRLYTICVLIKYEIWKCKFMTMILHVYKV